MDDIRWEQIRALNGSQSNAFEELCAQLARSENPIGFIRKGAPDAGVECFRIEADGSETGWQAKYFFQLGSSQWGQLDSSVKTALDKHPRLKRYVVCLPMDRPDARRDDQTSALEQWDAHVTKWRSWASERSMQVEFEFNGSSELLTTLSRQEHAGKVRFWFGSVVLDEDWFAMRFEEAWLAAGPRYRAEVNVAVSLVGSFEAFGRTPEFEKSVRSRALEIRTSFERVRLPGDVRQEILEQAEAVSMTVEKVLSDTFGFAVAPVADQAFEDLVSVITTARQNCQKLGEELSREAEQLNQLSAEERMNSLWRPEEGRGIRDIQSSVSELEWRLLQLEEELQDSAKIANHSLLVLEGEAGSGKTHFLCDLTMRRLSQGLPTVLLMGQRFVATTDPWEQALRLLDIGSYSAEEFVGALESAAQASNQRALFIVDALNEGAGRLLWPAHLASFLQKLQRSPWIGTVLSVRQTYKDLVVPKDVLSRANLQTHEGFAGKEYDALRVYCAFYKLELPSMPLLAPEFTNPLFLRTLCAGLEESQRFPRGTKGITSIFASYLDAIEGNLSKRLQFHPRLKLVLRALRSYAKEVAYRRRRWLPIEEAMALIDGLLPGRDFGNSLYFGLVDEGLLVEELVWGDDGSPVEVVILGYERFGDHLITAALLDGYFADDSPSPLFAKDGPLEFVGSSDDHAGLIEALAIQIPERFGHELLNVVPDLSPRVSARALLQSIVWRSPQAFSSETTRLLEEMLATPPLVRRTFDALLLVATVPGHPYNVRFLTDRFTQLAMADRDAQWSTYLHYAWDGSGPIHRIVDWGTQLTPKESPEDETLLLCAETLAWFLTTSNRFLRDRATKALVQLATGRLRVVEYLLGKFAGIDDLYVLERLYAAAYGVAMRSRDAETVGSLAAKVFERIFSVGPPPVHVLLRDYARGVCERAYFLDPATAPDPQRFRPPYGSPWPVIPSEEDIEAMKAAWEKVDYDSGDSEWSRGRIIWSVTDDDFSRYVIGTNNHYTNWLSIPLSEPQWLSPQKRLGAVIQSLSQAEYLAWKALQAIPSPRVQHLTSAQRSSLLTILREPWSNP